MSHGKMQSNRVISAVEKFGINKISYCMNTINGNIHPFTIKIKMNKKRRELDSESSFNFCGMHFRL